MPIAALLLAAWLVAPLVASAGDRITLGMREASLDEVMAMLARQHRVNILLGDGVDAEVSFSLYNVTLDDAIRSIANAAGYEVERRKGTYFILPEDRAGRSADGGFTTVRSIPVRYTDAAELETKLADYLSDFGNITALPDRGLLVVEDRPGFVYRISRLVSELDQRPPQVMIEAKILEISLSDEQSYGIDWTGLFTNTDRSGVGDFGTQAAAPGNSGNAGFFFNYLEPNIQVALRALEADGRVRNLASPKVVTVVNEEAEVIIGDRRGYAVTTTINQVTTESIEFLESGTILRVTPAIDDSGQILLNIHPEVSTGTVDENGIPSQTTTEVTTQLLVPNGKSIFIGGLMRNSTTGTRNGVPILGRLPGLRWLFSTKSRVTLNTETVVIITPRLVDEAEVLALNEQASEIFDDAQQEMIDQSEVVKQHIEDTFVKPPPSDRTIGSDAADVTPAGEVITRAEPEPSAPAESVAPAPPPAPEPEEPAAGIDSEPAIAPDVAMLAEAAVDAEAEAEAEAVKAAPTPVVARPSATARYALNLHSDPKPIEAPPGEKPAPDDRLLYVSEKELDGQTWYRLRLGFFDTENEAQSALEEWRVDYPSAWLVRVAPKERDAAPDGAL